MLNSKKNIEMELYNELNTLRKSRNDLIHYGKVPNRINAGYVLVAIKKLVQVLFKIEMNFKNPGWSYSGSWTENK